MQPAHKDKLLSLLSSSDTTLDTLLSILDALPELGFILTRNGEYLSTFGGKESLLVTSASKLIGKKVHDVMPKDKADFIINTIHSAIDKNSNISVVYELEVKSGVRTFEAEITPIPKPIMGEPVVIWFARDITTTRSLQQNLSHLAYYDSLTDIPNRRFLIQRLEEENARCGRQNKKSAVVFFDLDNFKSINDVLGHNIGDLVLIEAAQRLKSLIRKDDFLCRLGGDEFIVILSMIGETTSDAKQNAQVSCEHLAEGLEKPMKINEHKITVTASFGISLLPQCNLDSSKLLDEADRAMYLDKSRKNGQDI